MSMGDKVYTDKEVVTLVEGVPTTVTVQEPSDGNVGGRIGQRSYRCVICGFAYKEKDTVIFRGKPYGKPCGCYKDIQSILLSERANRQRHTANESRDRR
jgi:hypothetical protein